MLLSVEKGSIKNLRWFKSVFKIFDYYWDIVRVFIGSVSE